MARMIEGGEDPQFIARRLIISAAEDIGLANPNALLLANAAFDSVMKIGWPEARITLAEVAVYLAVSPKSNSTYQGIGAALAEVRNSGNQPVPLHLCNAPTELMASLGYHDGYKNPQNIKDTLQNNNICQIHLQINVFGIHNIHHKKKNTISGCYNVGEINIKIKENENSRFRWLCS